MSGDWPAFKSGSGGYLLTDLFQIDPMVLGDLGAYFAVNLSQIIPNIDQIPGYSAQTPYQATPVNAEETTTSTSYVDLTTIGPKLSTLPDGKYQISWGSAAKTSNSGIRAKMSVSLNGAAVDNTLQAYTLSTTSVGVSYTTTATLQGQTGGNTITCKYAMGASGATGTWGGRWLFALYLSRP